MKRRQKGFTLKDLMIVVAIIVIVVFWVNTFPRDWKRATSKVGNGLVGTVVVCQSVVYRFLSA